jgi:hypothetical protein
VTTMFAKVKIADDGGKVTGAAGPVLLGLGRHLLVSGCRFSCRTGKKVA